MVRSKNIVGRRTQRDAGAIEKAKAEKQQSERAALKAKMAEMAAKAGFDLHKLFDGRGKGKRGKVAVKYRDPNNAANTWTDRGRMPRWLIGGDQRREGEAGRFSDRLMLLIGT